MRTLLTAAFFLICMALQAQKPEMLETIEDVTKQASAELELAMSPPEGLLYKFGQKYHISGEYSMLLTLRNKGQVVSVFVQDKKDGNIPSQNKLKDKLLDFQFSFKMPKNKDYKLSYIFKF